MTRLGGEGAAGPGEAATALMPRKEAPERPTAAAPPAAPQTGETAIAGASPIPDPATAEEERGLTERLRRRARRKRILSLAVGGALLLFAGWIFQRWAAHVTLEELLREMDEIGPTQVGLAVGFTALSFVALIGYEFYAVQFTRRRLSAPLVALYSFITQGIAHATGFAILVGATVRYKLYSARGFDLVDVAKIQIYFTTAFGLAVFTVGGLALLLDPGPLAAATGLATVWWRILGGLLLVAVAAVVLVGAVLHRRFRIFGHLVDLPGVMATLALISLGVGDLLGIAAALHVLLPADLHLGFFQTLNIFVAALALGLVSNVPGSLGVFEGAVVLLISPSPGLAAPLISSLIMFRAVYYMLPLLLAILGFGAVELSRLRRRRA